MFFNFSWIKVLAAWFQNKIRRLGIKHECEIWYIELQSFFCFQEFFPPVQQKFWLQQSPVRFLCQLCPSHTPLQTPSWLRVCFSAPKLQQCTLFQSLQWVCRAGVNLWQLLSFSFPFPEVLFVLYYKRTLCLLYHFHIDFARNDLW